jgi:hypothetical protein
VSTRTVYRDVADLIGQRVPIEGEPGLGYVLASGFDMPPLMLTPDEIEAAVLGAQWVAERGDPVLAHAARDLVSKIATAVRSAYGSNCLSLTEHVHEAGDLIAAVTKRDDSSRRCAGRIARPVNKSARQRAAADSPALSRRLDNRSCLVRCAHKLVSTRSPGERRGSCLSDGVAR